MASEQGGPVQTAERTQDSSEVVQAILFDMVSISASVTSLPCHITVQ